MAKVLFVADMHIKIGQKSVPREWARNRYDILFSELARVKHKYGVDYEIHGGDIFDKMPTLEELGIFLKYVSNQLNPIYLFDGNHEATRKGETFLSLTEDMLKSIHPNITLFTDYYSSTPEFPFDVLPYCKLKEYAKDKPYDFKGKALITHVRGEIPPHVQPEVDLKIFKQWDVVFAGDLHSHSNTQMNIVYPGSPVTTSFHRTETQTGVLIIDDTDMSWQWVELEVPQLIRLTVDSEEDMVPTDFHHTVYELEGDAIDLSNVNKENPLLDKKIVKHKTDSTLNLEGLSIKEELSLYLKEIRTLNDEKLKEALRVYDDYIT